MKNNIISGLETAKKLKEKLKGTCNPNDTLACIVVGDNKASAVYVRNKEKSCADVNIKSKVVRLHETTTEQELLNVIDELNNDNSIKGIIVQLPLPSHINETIAINAISPEKDVDGFTPVNMGKSMLGLDGFKPATPKGIMTLLKENNIGIEGKHVVIVGRSNIVGKPLAMLMLHENATVTVCHSKTKNLSTFTKMADILVVAVGKPCFITPSYISEHTVIVDVGINKTDTGLIGDCDPCILDCFDNVQMTPVPGGVGPMTVYTLIENVARQ